MEVALRGRLEGVEDISISQGQQTVQVEFATASRAFSPAVFRDIVDDVGIEVLTMRVDACGVVEENQSQRWFVAGENRYLLEEAGSAPIGQSLCLTGRLDDKATPPTLSATTVQPST